MDKPIQHNTQGDPLELDTLRNVAIIDRADIESAKQWFDDNASADFIGALDSKPIGDNGG